MVVLVSSLLDWRDPVDEFTDVGGSESCQRTCESYISLSVAGRIITCQIEEAEGAVATNESSLAGMLQGRTRLYKTATLLLHVLGNETWTSDAIQNSIRWHRVYRIARSRYTEPVSLGNFHDWSLLRISTNNTTSHHQKYPISMSWVVLTTVLPIQTNNHMSLHNRFQRQGPSA